MIISICVLVLVLFLSACSAEKSADFSLRMMDDILLPYTPVRNQGRTQTCWAYTMASMLESERLTSASDTLRLSVMYMVRQKYMNQFEQYYYSQGTREIRNGGLGHSFLRVLEEKGAMPYEAYKGHLPDAKRHDHRSLLKELKSLAEQAVEEKDLSVYRQKAKRILDKYLGAVPEKFMYKGKEYTPQSFADSFNLNTGQYVELTSFTHHPFYEWFVLEVPDNWEHAPFYNVPIDSLEQCVKHALRNGCTVAWDGDISEEGFMPASGVAIYSKDSVTQEERQQGFEKFETTDDHMMHIVGTAHDENGDFYYILKNSWGKHGPYRGLMYMSENYFRAKTISVVIPRKFVSL